MMRLEVCVSFKATLKIKGSMSITQLSRCSFYALRGSRTAVPRVHWRVPEVLSGPAMPELSDPIVGASPYSRESVGFSGGYMEVWLHSHLSACPGCPLTR